MRQSTLMLREFYEAQGEKAIPYTMELTDLGGPLIGPGVGFYGANNPYVPGNTVNYARSNTPLSQREALVHEQVFGGSEPVDWLMDALTFTTQSASSADFHFEDDAGKHYVVQRKPTDPPDIDEVPPLLGTLIDSPNPYMDWEEFLELTLIDWFLLGNAYWVKWKTTTKNQPIALYRMAPQHVRILPDQFGPAKYLYKLPGMQEIEFTPDKVLHFKRPNPNDPYFGVGIVKGGARAIDMELALTNTTAAYYENQATPSGVVQTERRVPRDVFNKLKAQLQSFYGGSANAGRLLVLEAGLQWTSVSASAANAMFAEMGTWSRDRILAMFNMNAALLGMGDPADGSQVAGWQQLFDRKTMLPLLRKFGKSISRGLTQPGWGLNLVFDYEVTQAPEDVINRANLYAKLPGIKVKELRASAGLAPSTGNKEVDEYILNLPGPNMDSTGQGGTADRNLPGEAGRPPLPENTKLLGLGSTGPAGGNGVASGKATELSEIQLLIDSLSARESALEGKALSPARVHIGKIQTAMPPEDTLHPSRTATVDSIVAGMRRDMQDAVHALERGLLDATEGKANGTMYRKVQNSPAWAAFRKRLGEILTAGVERALSMANIHHANAGHAAADADFAKAAKQQLAREDGLLSIVSNFKQEVLQKVLSLQRHGANPGEFTHSIMESTKNWLENHAPTVALTEATIAYNEGTALVADKNGLNLLVSDGEDDDGPCRAANGQVWTPEYARDNYLEHPNCRRAFVPIDRPTTLAKSASIDG